MPISILSDNSVHQALKFKTKSIQILQSYPMCLYRRLGKCLEKRSITFLEKVTAFSKKIKGRKENNQAILNENKMKI